MFTIGATAQDFSICLRCQSRLSLKRSGRPRRRPQIEGTTRPRAFTTSLGQRQEDSQTVHEDSTSSPQFNVRYVSPKHDTPGTFRPPPKLPLGVDSLGKPAEVLVMGKKSRAMKNLGVIFADGKLSPLPPALKSGSEALLHEIDYTRGIPDLDHVCANIDSVRVDFLKSRPRIGQALSAEEYDELLSTLLKGFQKKHLLEYWQRRQSAIVVDALNLSVPHSSALLARTEWYSGGLLGLDKRKTSAPPLQDTNDVQATSVPRGLLISKGRQWHAENIIQSCWGLQKDLDGKTGGLAMRLKPTHMKLLLGHASNPLKQLSQTYSIKLDIDRVQNVIRVEADFHTCEAVVRMLLQMLDRIRSTSISLDPESPAALKRNLKKDYVKEVEEITGTVLSRGRGAKIYEASLLIYIVHYFGPEESDLEDVQRLLKNEAGAKVTSPVGDVWIKVPVDSTTSATPKEFGESLPLIARGTQWARFVDDHGCRFDSEGSTIQSLGGKPLEEFPYSDLVVDQVHRFMSHRGKSSKLSINAVHEHWETNLTRWSQVILGQVAFPLHQAQKLEAKLKNAKTNAELAFGGAGKSISTMDRVFATTLPGMTRALEAADLSLRPVERLQIRMMPESTPDLPVELTHLIPTLEIIVKIDIREKTTLLQSARLILAHEEQDLLLPSHPTDLRLMRREYLYCNQKEVDNSQGEVAHLEQQPTDPGLTAFIEESQLNTWGSQRLRTPNHLQLSIPTSAIPAAKGAQSLPASSVIPVTYRFAGIEHRSFVSLAPIGTCTPEYNTIQAGRTGGRREELAIRLGRPRNGGDRPWDVSRDTAKGLLETALQVVTSMR